MQIKNFLISIAVLLAMTGLAGAQVPQRVSLPTAQPPAREEPTTLFRQIGNFLRDLGQQIVSSVVFVDTEDSTECLAFACPEVRDRCDLQVRDVFQPQNDFELSYACEGRFADCYITVTNSENNKTTRIAAGINGEGRRHHTFDDFVILNEPAALQFQIWSDYADGRIDDVVRACDAKPIAHIFQVGGGPPVAVASRTYIQGGWRFYQNADSVIPGGNVAQLNEGINATEGDDFRLRVLLHVNISDLPVSGENFKLQYLKVAEEIIGFKNESKNLAKRALRWLVKTVLAAVVSGRNSEVDETLCSLSGTLDTGFPAGTPWADVTASTPIAYNDNASVADGAFISTTNIIIGGSPVSDPTHGAPIDHTVRPQTYEESNNFTNASTSISVGADGMWDFALTVRNVEFDFATDVYCLRVAKSDGTALESYQTFYTSGPAGNHVYPEVWASKQ